MARAIKTTSALLQRAMRSSVARPQLLARSVGIRAVQLLPLLARSGFHQGATTNSLARTPTVSVGSVGFFSTAAPVSVPLSLGDRVELTLVGKLANGEPFGQTAGDRPIAFIVGSGDVIPGIEEAVIGLVKGDHKRVEIPPAKAFGKTKQIHSIPRQQMNLPKEDDKKLAVGEILQLQNGETARIVKVTDEVVDIDLSHPYAGETLYVDLTIMETTARDLLSAEEQLVLPEEVAPGDGVTFPARGDTLVMHYTGKLASNGEVFDSSRTRNQPFQFQIGVGQVIRGWDEGVLRMSKGQKALLRIPSAKGYGKTGAGGVIPPNADLLFEVELLDILRPGQ